MRGSERCVLRNVTGTKISSGSTSYAIHNFKFKTETTKARHGAWWASTGYIQYPSTLPSSEGRPCSLMLPLSL
jgi:hypothetical protein